MPLYLFEYFDDEGERHEFKDFYNFNHDFTLVKSPCGLYDAQKILSTEMAVQNGMTAAEKNQGTTKQRIEYSKFMREQKLIRKKTYDPNSREHKSNEIWTGNEGKDGVTQIPIDKKVSGKKE